MQSSRCRPPFGTLCLTPTIQLCEGAFSPAPNKTVAIIILDTPFWGVSVFGFGVGDHTMGMSWKPPFKENNLTFFALLSICMHPSCPVTPK